MVAPSGQGGSEPRITDQFAPAIRQHPRTPAFIQVYREDQAALKEELRAGLLADQAQVSPKFLYDALGSRLFEAITELPEYYPTRTEAAIFTAHGAEMATLIPPQATLIDLGAGNCAKAASLFGRFRPDRYVAVDISVDFLRGSLECLQRQHPELEMWGLGVDFSRGLELPAAIEMAAQGSPRVLFYPGSSIGNFTPEEAEGFLASLHTVCRAGAAGGGLLIGVDLVKDTAELEAAYDDALGVTAAFNLNLLLNLNRILGADFQLTDWRHLARYDEARQRIEMHLQARRSVAVRWGPEPTRQAPGGSSLSSGPVEGIELRRFMAGQTLHTENSCKWKASDFQSTLARTGFTSARHWTDPSQRFAVFWASVTA